MPTMINAILCFFRGEYITLDEHAEALREVSDKIDAHHNKHAADLQSQIDKLQDANKTLAYNNNVITADLASVLKNLADANANAVHLQAAVENLRGDLSVSNGSRDRAHIKISAAMKALQS